MAENDGGRRATSPDTSHERSIEERQFFVVGVGASAGGLEALEQMFRTLPENSGMAFVIVQHLSPDFKSLMAELLARHTKMSIYRVEDGMIVEPNSLYLIPPKQEMIISNGKLLLTEKDSSNSLSLPIDHFLRSLAQDAGQRGIAIILSGTGSDGSRGIRDVHEAGGLVIAQSMESAKFDGMPKSAIDTGVVDSIIPPHQIADVLNRYVKYPSRSNLESPPLHESAFEHVFRLLQERHQIDFNFYKPSTIGRRIDRRIHLNHDGNIEDYVQRLENDPAEIERLYKDLLIGVTRFFRDRDAFMALQDEIMSQLRTAKNANEEFRVWVAGCGTGEEAYSVAILIDECMRKLDTHPPVKIFATDVHQTSLNFAHAGIYPESSTEDLENDRLARYFQKVDNGHQILPEIRKMIVFAPHNLIKDAPFTRLHLITCRNLLIYFQTMAQKKVLSLFHFGLKTGGTLFLGASERTGDLSSEFSLVNERWKIYRKRRDIQLSDDIRLNMGFTGRMAPRELAHPAAPRDHKLLSVYDELLDQFMPAGILINEDREIIHLFGGAGQFLSLSDGRLSANLLDMVDDDLKLALTGGLQRVAKTGESVRYGRVRIRTANGEKQMRVDVSPRQRKGLSPIYLITFEELELLTDSLHDVPRSIDLDEASRHQLQDMEQELQHTKENLQATIEELETSNEELQATNEELVASNEELQSTNEELHSVNEELYTVNAEYQKKISELTELTDDMNNLLVSTEVHTLFLDRQLCIRKFTPMMAKVFNLVPHDIGRRIQAFTHNIVCESLTDKLAQVLHSGETYEEKVQDSNGHHFLMRVLPYQVWQGNTGVVFTLIDIASLVAAQESIVRERERFERAITANRDGTWDWPDVKQDEMWWSPHCYTLLGYEPDEFPARHSEWLKLIHPDDRKRVQETSVPDQDTCFVRVHRDFEYRMLNKSGEYRWYRHRAIVDEDEAGIPIRMTGSVGDIHQRKCAELQNTEDIRRRDDFLAMLSHELRNPIGAVLNAIHYLNALEKQNGTSSALLQMDPKETAQPLRVIDRQAKHMARLLDDLLDVARYGHSKIEFRKQVIDLVSLVDDILEAVQHQFDCKHQTLHTTSSSSSLLVHVDPARIKQAQVNLLNNASKYTPEQGEIWFELERQANNAMITVRDNGEGIPPESLHDIFDFFVQSDTSLARSAGGMGIGLSLARSIVEAHDGRIEVQSTGVGNGSTFRIFLPLTQKNQPPSISAPHFSFKSCKVMLVEDNEDAGQLLAKTLRLDGFEVMVVHDGQAALNQFPSFNPDVAIIDIGLPVMDGYQLVTQIRQQAEFDEVMLIALTGYGRESDQQKAIEVGFNTYLVKPLDTARLYAEISAKWKQAPQS